MQIHQYEIKILLFPEYQELFDRFSAWVTNIPQPNQGIY